MMTWALRAIGIVGLIVLGLFLWPAIIGSYILAKRCTDSADLLSLVGGFVLVLLVSGAWYELLAYPLSVLFYDIFISWSSG